MTGRKLARLGGKVQTVSLSPLKASTAQPGKPWAKGADAPVRLRGRALQARNERVKLRDKYRCQHCGIVTTELEVDHIVPLSLGGLDTDDACQSLCVPCHSAKTKREHAERAAGGP